MIDQDGLESFQGLLKVVSENLGYDIKRTGWRWMSKYGNECKTIKSDNMSPLARARHHDKYLMALRLKVYCFSCKFYLKLFNDISWELHASM